MKKLKSFILLLFAFTMSLNADAQAVLDSRILTSGGFSGYNYESEYNLWKPVDDNNSYTTSFYCTENWSHLIEPAFSKNGSEYEFGFMHQSDCQWKSQCTIIPNNLKLRAGTKYDVSFVVYGNLNVPNATVNICDVNNSGNSLASGMFSVVSYKSNVIYMTGVDGLTSDSNIRLMFDFGGNPYGADVSVYNIVIKEHANDDGTVLPAPIPPFYPGQQELVYNSDDNMWKAIDDNSNSQNTFFYSTPDWYALPNPEFNHQGSTYTLSFPTATANVWQAQWQMIPASLTIGSGKLYDMSMTINSNVDLQDIIVRLTEAGAPDVIIMDKTFNVEAGVDCELRLWTDQRLSQDYNVALLFGFGNNPDNTFITVKDITLVERSENVATPTAEQTDLSYHVFNTGEAYVMGVVRPVEHVKIPETVKIDGTTYPVTGIYHQAFHGCFSLTDIQIPNSVAVVGDEIFKYCNSLRQANIPSGLRRITTNMFYGCSSLTDIVIPASVKTIEEAAFCDCRNLRTVNFNNGLETIGKYAFANCEGLSYVGLPYTLKEISEYAFYITGLTSLALPNGLTTIGESAFAACDNLSDITIPNTVTSIAPVAFGCGKLTSIAVEEGNPVYDSRNGCNAVIETATNTLISGCAGTTIPEDVTALGDRAFSNQYMKSVTIPASVTSIAPSAFYCCYWMYDITNLSTEPQPIGEFTFYGANSNARLHVMPGCKSAYMNADYWNQFYIIEDAHLQAYDNVLFIEPVEASSGRQVTVSVKMKNNADVQTIGVYVKLPDGITVAKNANDQYMIELSNERTSADRHAISARCVDGIYRIGVLGTAGLPFSSVGSDVFTMTLNIPADMPSGNYTIELSNIELTDTNNQTYNTGAITSTLTIDSLATGISTISTTDDATAIYGINGQQQTDMHRGMKIVRSNNGIRKVIQK